ncbi:LOW QUALITY PROTEIN: sperm-associated antigen 16 protein-like [Lates calcarifer]|uniref:LOW QUALITY PROTEIN: sperm-associated antigen 16 protein-like n=1 Tax=Lates calcarifer TaxID=8187 RepID=A0AAJ7PGD1_LATCA|nr:LOW QUALITY PROTEIN: sperm-associated antigen 16 protein-like [Lates calcarifer]
MRSEAEERKCQLRGKETAEEEKKEVFSEEEENFEEALREAASTAAARRRSGLPNPQIIRNIPEVVDDFLRNFLRRAGLSRTLNSFEAEWYSSAQKHLTETLMPETPTQVSSFIPDALTHSQLLQSELERVRGETERLRQELLAAGESLVRTQRERGFHRLQYRQVAEDKNRLIEDLNQLKRHLESYEPALRQLDDKYQAALRQRMLITLEKDRVQNTSDARLNREKVEKGRGIKRSDSADKSSAKSPITRQSRDSQFPIYSRQLSPHLAQAKSQKWKNPGSFSLSCSIRAHKMPISCISLHPRKLILASASDDRSWRLWALPANGEKVGQMMLTGEGHSDWLSGCSFHPDGSKLATTSGDTTVRLWDFSRGCCVLTLSGHCQVTWGCSFHSCGHFLASCSADKTVKLWDLKSQLCLLTLRRHTTSVNSVCFLPFSNLLLSCSADKTLALWDARLGVCTTTIHGHLHPCNHASFSPAGNVVASCDSSGVVNLWDIRKPASAMATVDAGSLGANQVVFSPFGKMLAVACSDRLVKLVKVDSRAVSTLSGHSDGVQSVTFDHTGESVMSAGSDGLINMWSEHEVNEETKK